MQLVRATDDTFCIAVLGDFLGEGSGSPHGIKSSWIPQRATPDTVMKLAGLRPRLRVPSLTGEEGEEVVFSSLEGFDPVELFQKLAIFGPFREAREAARTGRPETGQPEMAPGLPRIEERGDGDLLNAILDVTQPSVEAPEPGTSEELDAFVKEAVRPHLVRDDRDAKNRVAAVDEAASLRLSEILHAGSFQQLEAIWRSLVFLLSRIDTTGKVRVYLIHLPRPELERDLSENEDPVRSRLYDLLSAAELGAPGRRWALATGAYQFGSDPLEITLLERLARVAQAADVPWISAARPAWADESELHRQQGRSRFTAPPAAWTRFRTRPEAAWLGLTFPRFLLREPHGKAHRRGRVLDFRETTTSHTHLLWGLGPFLPAALLAQGFAAEGWGFPPENHLDVGGMPLGELQEDLGGSLSPVELSLSPGEVQMLMETGLMPLLGFPERAGIRMGGIHSVSASESSLAAWWRG